MSRETARVLMTTDAVGGVWTYALELCRALPEAMFLLANMGPAPSRAQRREMACLRNVQLVAGGFALEWEPDPWRDVGRAGCWLRHWQARFAPDVVHLNGYAHAALPWKVPVLVVAHSCVLSWWRAVHGGAAPARYQRYAEAVTNGLRSCQRIVAPSQAMAESLQQHYAVERVQVIANGIDGSRFHPRTAKQPIVLAAGRWWDGGKNIQPLVEAAAGLPWPLCLAGPGGGRQAANVRTLGACPRDVMSGWYERAAVFAHPACYEPFGMAPLEAAAAGCALVLSNIPSLRETWPGCAIFVEPHDPAAWRTALKRLIDEPGTRAELAGRAMARAKQLTARRMAVAYHRIYQEMRWSQLLAAP